MRSNWQIISRKYFYQGKFCNSHELSKKKKRKNVAAQRWKGTCETQRWMGRNLQENNGTCGKRTSRKGCSENYVKIVFLYTMFSLFEIGLYLDHSASYYRNDQFDRSVVHSGFIVRSAIQRELEKRKQCPGALFQQWQTGVSRSRESRRKHVKLSNAWKTNRVLFALPSAKRDHKRKYNQRG